MPPSSNSARSRGIAGATVIRCVEGYGGSGHLHTARLLELSENLPVRIEIVDIAERIEPLLAALEPMIGEGLLTVVDVRIRRYLPDPKQSAPFRAEENKDEMGKKCFKSTSSAGRPRDA